MPRPAKPLRLKEAWKAFQAKEVPVGAVVVCDNRIIARSFNTTEKLNDVTAHAEMLAITSASNHLGGKYLNYCTLFVTLEPCTMCAGALFWTQIDKLVYGADDPKRGFLSHGPQLLHPKTKVTKGVLAEESTAMLKEFFSKKRG